jgi:hypothetical protein
MAASATQPRPVRADYLGGDPREQGPIMRGRLEVEERGLRFSAPDAPELWIELQELEALTVSGRSPYERPKRSQRGTMRLAARRNGSVDVWEFAVERRAGATLRDWINREMHMRGLRRPPLPFVEQIVGPIETSDRAATERSPGRAPEETPDRSFSLRRPRVIAFALAASVVVGGEIVAAIALLS